MAKKLNGWHATKHKRFLAHLSIKDREPYVPQINGHTIRRKGKKILSIDRARHLKELNQEN